MPVHRSFWLLKLKLCHWRTVKLGCPIGCLPPMMGLSLIQCKQPWLQALSPTPQLCNLLFTSLCIENKLSSIIYLNKKVSWSENFFYTGLQSQLTAIFVDIHVSAQNFCQIQKYFTILPKNKKNTSKLLQLFLSFYLPIHLIQLCVATYICISFYLITANQILHSINMSLGPIWHLLVAPSNWWWATYRNTCFLVLT
jgi:hypothetical protein